MSGGSISGPFGSAVARSVRTSAGGSSWLAERDGRAGIGLVISLGLRVLVAYGPAPGRAVLPADDQPKILTQ